MNMNTNNGLWSIHTGDGPIIATAIHNGHEVRPEIAEVLAIAEQDRLREEDPYTGLLTEVVDNRAIVYKSRFEIDLNRNRDMCIYSNPEESWGMAVYKQSLTPEMRQASLQLYDEFYQDLYKLCTKVQQQHGFFVVLDLHSYNHHRLGPDQPFDDPEKNPEINVGTGTMTHKDQWRPLINTFIQDLHTFDFAGHNLDVRENIKFLGGNLAKWVHAKFAGQVCCLSIEFKKIFMDEWTATLYQDKHELLKRALTATLSGVLSHLELLSGNA